MLLKLSDSEDFYKTIVDRLNQGGIVALPTDTVYGLAVDAANGAAVEKLGRLKGRVSKPYTFFIPKNKLDHYALVVKKKIVDYFMPGPLTVLLKKNGGVSLPRTGDKIGIRIPQTDFIARLLNTFPRPLAVTSANRAGAPTFVSAYEIVENLTDVELVVDGGNLSGPASTVIDLTTTPATVIRKGAVPILEIEKVQGQKTVLAEGLQFNMLFVCTGNTCRSPIAAGLARKFLAEQNGCEVSDLRKCGLEVLSAGLFAAEGGRASPEAVRAARELDADISRHRSRKVTTELINSADVIFCMTSRHVAEICRMSPSAAGKTQRLDESADIVDPIGGGVEVYCRIAQNVQRALRNRLKEGLL